MYLNNGGGGRRSNSHDYSHDGSEDESDDNHTTYHALERFYDEHCTYLPAMAGWFIFSAILSSYNKYVFGEDHMHFPCPLLLTSIHFLIQWVFSWTASEIFPEYLGTDRLRNMSWTEWMAISLPCGWVTSGDIGLSNVSLVTISITFYTMIKASTPIFVLVWAYLFGIEKITWSLLGVILVIAIGELLTVAGEVKFDLMGFLLCLTASMLSGARWTLVQLKLQTMEPPLKTTIVTMRLLAPSMFLSMIAISLLVENPIATLHQDEKIQSELAELVALGVVGGVIAICMILCEFYLILKASAIILMIGGVIKEIITIFIGVNFFHDHLNATNLLGCGVVFSGVVLYKITFHLQKQEEAKLRRDAAVVVRKEDMHGLLAPSSSMEEGEENGNGRHRPDSRRNQTRSVDI